MYTLPSDNQWDWEPGVDVGVIGGINQYYIGGASERTTNTNGADHLNISLAPYGANPLSPSTTATGSAGSNSVVVADATGFRVDDLVELVISFTEVSQVIVNNPASSSGNIIITLDGVTAGTIPVDAGDSATVVATKLRAESYSGWTTGGSGTTVTWTANAPGDRYTGLVYNPSGTGASGTASTIDGGLYSNHVITSIVGTTIGITPAIPAGDGATDAVFRSDNSAAINAALAALTAEQVAYLPAGTYDIFRPLYLTASNITLRGDGPTLTIIKGAALLPTMLRIGTGYFFNANSETVTAGLTKGSAVLTVADSTGYSVGHLIYVMLGNELDDTRIQAGAAPRINVFGDEGSLAYLAKVTAVSAGTVTVDPPLPFDGTNVGVTLWQRQGNPLIEKVGVEDIYFDGDNYNEGLSYLQSGIAFLQVSECWMRNVRVSHYNNYGVSLDSCFRQEIRHSIVGPGRVGGTNSAGILTKTSRSLFEDNIVLSNSSTIQQNDGALGNAWLYNCLPTNIGGNDMLANHGPHNCFNLWEGNTAHSWKSDGYFGSLSHDVLYRNWLNGYDGENAGDAIYLKRFTRNMVLAGNVYGWDGFSTGTVEFGCPNIGNPSFTGTAEPTTGDFWADWKITGVVAEVISSTDVKITVNKVGTMIVGTGSGGNGPALNWLVGSVRTQQRNFEVTAISGLDVTFHCMSAPAAMPELGETVEVWAGQTLFQEKDLDVENSSTTDHNYASLVSGTGAITDSISPDTLPNSLSYPSQPSWWTEGGFAGSWPPVNPDSPTFSYEIIPAGYRYINGEQVATVNIRTFRLKPTLLRR